MELLSQASSGPAPLRELGVHPENGGNIAIYSGRYGPYVQHGKLRATLQKEQSPESLTLEEALELLAAKAAKEQPAKKTVTRKSAAKSKTTAAKAKKAPIKKAAAKKPAAKKTAAATKTAKKPSAD